jgi:23S rRNA (cytidine2498-2'-O)-methyltransferase
MHALLADRGSEPFLVQELHRAYPTGEHQVCSPGLVTTDFILQPEAPPTLVFARQLLPALAVENAESISAWSERLFNLACRIPDGQPWLLHVASHYGSGAAGQNRCRLIRDSLLTMLRQKRRHLLRSLISAPASFTPADSLLQLLLIAPTKALVSLAPAPLPFQLRRVLSPFLLGEIPVATDKAAPSRAFAKLLEVEQRLGQRIASGESCVDLGASPGSWTYVALGRGARVLAIDRAPLRPDLMRHPNLTFRKGDAFAFTPSAPVDWLLCDVIAAPLRSIDLLLHWVRHRLARRFVVTVKFKGTDEYSFLERVKYALPPLCDEFYLTRLSANKNEVCAFGTLTGPER